jgi:GDP-mannose transporter
MDNKKNEDYAINMSDLKGRDESPSQREPFLAKSPSRSGGGGSSSVGSLVPSSLQSFQNSPPLSILAYCFASISMTVTNKYCVSGANWNLNFFYLAIQVRYIL